VVPDVRDSSGLNLPDWERTETVHYNCRKTIDGDTATLGLSQDKSKVNTSRS